MGTLMASSDPWTLFGYMILAAIAWAGIDWITRKYFGFTIMPSDLK